ncbi:hypothetical protein BKA62DRAFT_381368 [Auriculariales sp. MPI-PUGE-AT-0066]|nr:hypothetical protein BKA62DRAFT_381368 [Auriculariales sp. MPI-PUGE-AT-0066]
MPAVRVELLPAHTHTLTTLTRLAETSSDLSISSYSKATMHKLAVMKLHAARMMARALVFIIHTFVLVVGVQLWADAYAVTAGRIIDSETQLRTSHCVVNSSLSLTVTVSDTRSSSITRGASWGNEFVRISGGVVQYAPDLHVTYPVKSQLCTDPVVRRITELHRAAHATADVMYVANPSSGHNMCPADHHQSRDTGNDEARIQCVQGFRQGGGTVTTCWRVGRFDDFGTVEAQESRCTIME